MATIVRITGGVPGIERYPELMEQIGRYLTRYEPKNALHGEQWIWTTDNPAEALRFKDAGEFHSLYIQSTGRVRPWDGKPDRPITALHVTLLPVED